MKREIFINVDGGETRVAVLEDGRLVEINVERPDEICAAGNVYKAKVENVLPGMQAAFVDIGLEKNAFLYVADAAPVVNPDEVEGDAPPKPRKGLAINKLLKPGQKIVVQVTKDPIGTKGARVSAYVTLPSHYVVLMPTVDYVGVSRRIADAKERARLRTIASRAKPRGMGIIVRTAAEGHSAEEVGADITYLQNLWRKIQSRSRGGKAPRVLHQDLGLVSRVVRDLLTESVSRVLVDSPGEHQRVRELLEEVSSDLQGRVELHDQSKGDLFSAHGIEAELDRALQRRVWLRNGGYLVIDETEAFTVFDVNTGRYVGSTSLAQTVLDTNLEAAAEVARQLRLRDIGGIIIADFIDMDQAEHRQKVLARLEEHLARDRTRSHVLGITQLGLVEMTRKKVHQSLGELMTKTCPTCEGRGRVLSEETVAARVRREMREVLRSSEAGALLAEVHPSVAALLVGAAGKELRELERELGKAVYVRAAEQQSHEGYRFRLFDTKAEIQTAPLPVQVGDVLELRVAEQHVSNRKDGVARFDGFVVDIEGGADRVGERVKVEVVKVHRTFAKAKILGPERPPRSGAAARPDNGDGAARAAGDQNKDDKKGDAPAKTARRSRRRRKNNRSGAAANEKEGAAGAPAAEERAGAAPSTEADQAPAPDPGGAAGTETTDAGRGENEVAAAQDPAEASGGEQPAKKKPRRRRGGRRKKPAAAGAATGESPDDGAADAAPASTDSKGGDDAPPRTDPPADGAAVKSSASPGKADADGGTADDGNKEAEPPKRRRGRRARRARRPSEPKDDANRVDSA